MVARLALCLGGLVAVLLTPAFALSYFLSYGEPDESPPAWLSQMQDPLTDAGLLVAGSTSSYDRYGLLYLAASALALAGLAGLLRREIMVALVFTLTIALRNFDIVWNTTRGGPGESTTVPSIYIYEGAFISREMGQSAAISVLLTVLILAMTAGIIGLFRERDPA